MTAMRFAVLQRWGRVGGGGSVALQTTGLTLFSKIPGFISVSERRID